MNSSTDNTLGLVLAAGFSRRFGTCDKRTALLNDGSTLLAHTLQRLCSSFSPGTPYSHLVVVIRREDDPLQLGIPPFCRTIRVDSAQQGLGASLAAACTALLHAKPALPANIDSLAVLLGDMPALQPGTLDGLIAQAKADTIVRPRYREQPGHPVLFGRRIWPELTQLSGDQGARAILAAHPEAVQLIDVADPGVIVDIDTPEQLRALASRGTA